MSQRSIGLSVRRPAETLSGRQWFVSLGCAGGSALGLGLLMKSPWVAATT